MITTLLFDFYGVFQPDPYAIWLKRHNLKRVGVYQDIAGQLDSGNISQSKFLELLSQASGIEVSFNEFYSEDTFNLSLIELIKELKPRYQIGLLSNASPSLRAKLSRHHIATLFDFIAISGEIGHAKPEPQAFNIALSGLNEKPMQTLFIDDNSDYTSAATALGMVGLTYKDMPTLLTELETREIL